MSFFVKPLGKKYQLRVTHKLLQKIKYATFPTEAEARTQGQMAQDSLDAGIVPRAWLEAPKFLFTDITGAIRAYRKAAGIRDSTDNLLSTLSRDIGDTLLSKLTNQWADEWVRTQKLNKHRTPGTIRHHVGALSRCLSWVSRTHPDHLLKNPLKDLPRNYSIYNELEQNAMLTQGLEVPEDSESVNRLMKHEEAASVKVLTERIERAKKAEQDGKPQDDYYGHSAVDWHTGALLIFLLALESCMRMREMYTLYWSQIDIPQRTVFLDKTKNGDSREVPLTTNAIQLLTAERKRTAANDNERVFPFWNGDTSVKVRNSTTSTVSTYFGRVFDQAGCGHFNFHDTRSEAICRLVLYIPPNGIKLSDTQIARITGHRDPRMLRRYMRLRGSELATMLP